MSEHKGKFVGVFDSGFGGIDILRGIVKELPFYDYLYLGDTARTPYGARSQEELYEFAKQAVDFLFMNDCELIIFACNTASAEALRTIQQEYLPKRYPDKKALGVLIPAAEEAIVKTKNASRFSRRFGGSKNKKVGVIATNSTVQSGAFIRELAKLDDKVNVFQHSCPLLVPIVEAGEQNSKAANIILENYLAPLKKKGIDTLILGCTHYGILEKSIRKIIGSDVAIISEAKVVPKKLKNYLGKHPKIEKKLGKNSTVQFYTTDLTDRFILLGSIFFGKKIKAEKVLLN